jgi:hypothetical protein
MSAGGAETHCRGSKDRPRQGMAECRGSRQTWPAAMGMDDPLGLFCRASLLQLFTSVFLATLGGIDLRRYRRLCWRRAAPLCFNGEAAWGMTGSRGLISWPLVGFIAAREPVSVLLPAANGFAGAFGSWGYFWAGTALFWVWRYADERRLERVGAMSRSAYKSAICTLLGLYWASFVIVWTGMALLLGCAVAARDDRRRRRW